MAEGRIIIKGENNISSSVKSAQKDLNSLNSTVQNLSKTFKTAFTATAILAGLNKIAKTVTSLAKEYTEVEQSISKLNSSSTLYGQNLSSLNRIIDTFSKQTMESKDTVREMVSELSALGKSESEISKITEASVALSNVTGKSLTESFNQMLSTLKGEVGELAKLDTSFANLTSEQLKHGDAVDEVIKKYGELSKSMADSSLSQNWKNISDTFSTIKQTSGKIILQFAEDSGFVNIVQTTLEQINYWVSKIYLKQLGLYDVYEAQFDKILNLEGLTGEQQAVVKEDIYNKLFYPYFYDEIGQAYDKLIGKYGSKENIPEQELENLFSGFTNAISIWGKDIIKNIKDVANYNAIKTYNESVLDNTAKKDYFYYEDEMGRLNSTITALESEIEKLENKWATDLDNGVERSKYYEELYENEQSSIVRIKNQEVTVTAKGVRQLLDKLEEIKDSYTQGYISNNTVINVPEVKLDDSLIDSMVEKINANTAKSEELASNKKTPSLPTSNTNNKTKFIGVDTEGNQSLSITPTVSNNTKKFNFTVTASLGDVSTNTDTMALLLGQSLEKQQRIADLQEQLPMELINLFSNTDFGYDIDSQLSSLENWATVITDPFEDHWSNIIANLGLGTEELVDGYNALINGAADGLFAAIQPLTDIIFSANPLLALILVILQDFVETLLPAIETVLAPVMDFLGSIGKLLAQTLYPVLEALYPWITMIVNVLANLVYPIIQMITPVMQVIAGILEALKPVLSIVLEAFTAIAIVLNWVAGLFEYVGDIIVTFGQNVGIALWNVLHPFDQKSYKSTTKSYKSFNQSANEVMQSNSNAFSGSVDLATSTSTAVQNASYSGGGTVTINIYQQGVVVGDNGMEEFARMIRTEFASLDYYGT